MKILYIHNISVWGGSLKSLQETINILSELENLDIHLILPKSTNLIDFQGKCIIHEFPGVPQFDSTLYGRYTFFRWLILIREVYKWVLFKKRFKSFVRENRNFDIIHFNEIVNFYACIGLVKKNYPDAKIVTHVRSMQNEKKTFYSHFLKKSLETKTDGIIAIDDCVARTVQVEKSKKIFIVPNAYSSESVDIKILPNNKLKILYLGGNNLGKGIDYLLEISKILKSNSFNGEIVIAGIKPDPKAYTRRAVNFLLHILFIRRQFTTAKLNRFILKHKLEQIIVKHGFTNDLTKLFFEKDLLLFPSRFNAPGRPSIEAMRYGVPSILFCKFSETNIIKNGFNGYNIQNYSIDQFVEKILKLNRDKELLERLKKNSFNYFQSNFNTKTHETRIIQIYESILNQKIS